MVLTPSKWRFRHDLFSVDGNDHSWMTRNKKGCYFDVRLRSIYLILAAVSRPIHQILDA